MKSADLWILPDFLGGGRCVPAVAGEPGAFEDGDGSGRWWKPQPKRALVAPPPEQRGESTVVYRAPVPVAELLASLSPPPSPQPENIAGYFDAPAIPEPEPVRIGPRTLDRVEVSKWRRIELPRPTRRIANG